MSYRISKTFQFSAAHHLPALPAGHKCRRVHGHNYRVTLELAADNLDGAAMVRDYGDLDPVRVWIGEHLDHRDLNHLDDQPTAERLARLVYDRWAAELPELAAVTVCETPATTATYTP